jgi:hypothetical protein
MAFEVLLPALAVGGIGQHEVELLRREGVVGEGAPFRAADDVVGVLALALEQHVGLADGVGLGVDFLAVQVGHLAALDSRWLSDREGFFGHGEHAAGAAGAVVEQVGAGFDAARRWAGRSDWP